MAENRSLTPVPPSWKALSKDPRNAAAALIRSWLAGMKATTLRAYSQSLDTFVCFLQVHPDVRAQIRSHEEAAAFFFALKKVEHANKLLLDYVNWMVGEKFAGASVNLKIAAVRSMAKLGRMLGLVGWTPEVKTPKAEAYRNTAGPGHEKIIRAIAVLRRQPDPQSSRDCALLAALYILGLRREEAVRLDTGDVELDKKRLFILGKGRSDEEPMTLPDPVCSLFRAWLSKRGPKPGPFFVNFDRAGKSERLTGRSVGRICHRHGLGHAHGLRHSAVTRALDINNGDIRKTARFSRHKNVQIILKYDDNRMDLGGEVAKGLADELE